ncbi:dolichyldiphosphatase 1-like [Haliotis rubra]|uniref:dolichyldiphosphatase 1-like n=1 Tax=Haliotis rubra TaxID=36100 RepID=UPI001EE4F2CF|nr:dolichyldiphosphatase 1-like [Haliotis rubra]
MASASSESNTIPGQEADTPLQWKAISLTHVEFVKGDIIGYGLAWLSLLPIFILVAFVTLIIFRRDLHTISFFLGMLVNEAINLVLKHIIREYRPMRDRKNVFNEYGMPSSHSQFMWFFSMYLTFFLFIRVYKNYTWLDDLWKYATSFGGFVVAALVSYSRVYLVYHSLGQVFWGAVAGIILGTLYFGVVQFVMTPLFPLIAACPLGELLMLRDSTLIPHVMWFEYTSSRTEARSRQRKMTARKSQ